MISKKKVYILNGGANMLLRIEQLPNHNDYQMWLKEYTNVRNKAMKMSLMEVKPL